MMKTGIINAADVVDEPANKNGRKRQDIEEESHEPAHAPFNAWR